MDKRERIESLANDLRGLCFHRIGASELAEHIIKLGYTRPAEPSLDMMKAIALRDKIVEAWWKIDTKTEQGEKLMPTSKEHKNLLGNKEKYLDAVLKLFPVPELTDDKLREQVEELLYKELEPYRPSHAKDWANYLSIQISALFTASIQAAVKKAVHAYSLKVFRHRDVRLKCRKCNRYMRFHPTPNSPAKRAEAPHAGTCVDCLQALQEQGQ